MSIQSIIKRTSRRSINLVTTSTVVLTNLTQLTLWDSELACGTALYDVLEPLTNTQQLAEAQSLTSHDDSWSV